MVEYLICAITALISGVGMGLVGLSSATILTPVLIVLCPSFSGIGGAYQAIALALGADIVSGILTAVVYAQNGHLKLARVKTFFICVLVMCIAGSVVATLVSNTVMGWFSIALCLVVGIRFLVKPASDVDEGTSRDAGQKRYISAVMVFFGVCIGFGIGFVGSGGGMIMVVLFTLLLGMRRKDAVGSAACITVFACAIAFVSHVLAAPQLISIHGGMLICAMICSTLTAVVSARFATKAADRTVGLIIGAVLTIAGLVLVVLRLM